MCNFLLFFFSLAVTETKTITSFGSSFLSSLFSVFVCFCVKNYNYFIPLSLSLAAHSSLINLPNAKKVPYLMTLVGGTSSDPVCFFFLLCVFFCVNNSRSFFVLFRVLQTTVIHHFFLDFLFFFFCLLFLFLHSIVTLIIISIRECVCLCVLCVCMCVPLKVPTSWTVPRPAGNP